MFSKLQNKYNFLLRKNGWKTGDYAYLLFYATSPRLVIHAPCPNIIIHRATCLES
jgi:hypothetical protein